MAEQQTHNMKFPGNKSQNSGGYHCCNVEQINMLLIGRTQSGKSTIFEALKNPEYSKTAKGFSETREPTCYRTVLIDENEGKGYMLNVIDTPGLKEVSKNGEESRSDQELLKMARHCIEQNLTTLNLICLVSSAGKTHQQDLEVFQPLMEFLGKDWDQNTLMILTHADGYDIDKLNEFEKDIAEHSLSKEAYNYCKLGICFHGIINCDRMAVFKDYPNIQEEMKQVELKHLVPLRKKLFEKIITAAKNRKEISQLADIARSTETERQRLIDKAVKENAAKKDGCIIS